MSAKSTSNLFGSPLKGSENRPTRTVAPIYQSPWEGLFDALQPVMGANEISEDEAKAAICLAVSDESIKIRSRLRTHASSGMSSKAVLDGSKFEIPTALKPRDLDWSQSRPTKPWVVKRGAYGLSGRWHLDLIELYKPDVRRVLCTAQRNQCPDGRPTQSLMTVLHSSKTVPARPKGPRAKKLQATIEAMKNDIRQGLLTRADLDGMLEKNLEARYSVSRDTARKARKIVLSEFVEAKTPTIDN